MILAKAAASEGSTNPLGRFGFSVALDAHQGRSEQEDHLAEALGLAIHREDPSGNEIDRALGLISGHSPKVQHHRALLLHRQNGLTCLGKAFGSHHHHLGDPLSERTLHGAAHLGLGWAESLAQDNRNASLPGSCEGWNQNAGGRTKQPLMWISTQGAPMDGSCTRFTAPGGLPSASFGEGMTIHRPTCDAGVASPGSNSLKWGSDGELTAQDLHHVLARLLVHDQEGCRMMDGDSGPILS